MPRNRRPRRSKQKGRKGKRPRAWHHNSFAGAVQAADLAPIDRAEAREAEARAESSRSAVELREHRAIWRSLERSSPAVLGELVPAVWP